MTSTVIFSCNDKTNKTQPTNQSSSSDKTFIGGEWTYRSMLNNPIDTIPFNNLEFATAIMQLSTYDNDSISGILDMGSSGKLIMKGKIYYYNTNISNFELQGDGVKETNTQGWIYNYYGFIVPKWKQGVNQVDALVGSVVRSVDHGQAKAGKVASFYMVRRK